MDFLWRVDWGRLFTPQMSLLEILIRGTLTYLALCLLLRIVLKRQAGKVSMSDLLVVALVAGVCRNPLVRDDYSVTDGVLVVATVLGWSFALDWLSYHSTAVHKLLHSPPVPLVQNGQVLKDKLRGELMTETQLGCKLRQHGVRGPEEVAEAWMEGDGHVSVIKKKSEEPSQCVEADRHSAECACAADEPPAATEVQTFLDAARRLEDKVARHRQVIAEQERGIAEARELLARFGFREAAVRRGKSRTAGTDHAGRGESSHHTGDQA